MRFPPFFLVSKPFFFTKSYTRLDDEQDGGAAIRNYLIKKTGQSSVPNVQAV